MPLDLDDDNMVVVVLDDFVDLLVDGQFFSVAGCALNAKSIKFWNQSHSGVVIRRWRGSLCMGWGPPFFYPILPVPCVVASSS